MLNVHPFDIPQAPFIGVGAGVGVGVGVVLELGILLLALQLILAHWFMPAHDQI